MTHVRLTARDRMVYAAGFLAAAALIYAVHYTSHDGDSNLYASIASYTTSELVGEWIAPKWWAIWPDSGLHELFIEHPAGLFWIPAALGRIGLPAGPSAYVVGIASALASLLAIGALADRVSGPRIARGVLILLPLMPVAFIFRVRANHEYPMLLCLVGALVALERVRRAWIWLGVTCVAFASALVIKGVFALLVIGACGLWLLLAPRAPEDRSGAWRSWVAFGAGVICLAAVAVWYDAWYARVTGHSFWAAYWARQVGPMTFASSLGQAGTIARHLGFYALHILWYSAPWTVVLVWLGVRRWLPARASSPVSLTGAERRAGWFVVLFTAASLASLSVPSRVAERYAFSASFLLGAMGIAASLAAWPKWRGWIERADAAIPALPAVVWAVTLIGRIALGPS